MPVVNKIKLPNNTTLDINDARDVIIGEGVENVVTLTSAQYQALAVKDANTVYILTDGVPPSGGGGGLQETVLDTSSLISNTYIKKEDGTETAYSGWSSTGFIDISDGIQIKADRNLAYSAFYSSNTTSSYISAANITTTYLIIPSNAQYIRLSGSTSDITAATVTLLAAGGSSGSGEENVIEIIKVNGTALTPDVNKAVDVTVPTKVSDLSNDSGFITDSGVVKTSGNQTIAGIKTFSSEVQMTAGGTSDITSGVVCSFKTNRAQITNFATHNILTGGTNSTTPITFYKYTAVSGQAPSSLVQLAKIDTDGNIYEGTTKLSDKYLTSFTETDPVYSASAAAGITSSDITNWNGKTSNVGTITGITMNGSSKGTSGVVNLGTVVTSETDPVFTASAAHGISSTDISNWNAKQKAITISSSEPTSSQGSNGDIWIVI